jgi:hypothetical protein
MDNGSNTIKDNKNLFTDYSPVIYKTGCIKQHCCLSVKNIEKDKKNVNILHLCEEKIQKKVFLKTKPSLFRLGLYLNEFV